VVVVILYIYERGCVCARGGVCVREREDVLLLDMNSHI